MGVVKFSPATVHGGQVGMKKGLMFRPTRRNNMGIDKNVSFSPALPSGLSSAGHSIVNNARFTPAVMGMLERSRDGFSPAWAINKNNDPATKFEGYTLDWWTPTSIFNYDMLLVSAFYGMDIWDFREHYKIPRDDFTLLADSGGFQIYSQGIKIDPVNLLRWIEKNADIGLTLDVPPLMDGSIAHDRSTEHQFDLSIKKTRENYELMESNRQSNDLILLKVIHGFSVKEQRKFYKAMKGIEFDGHAIGSNPSDLTSLASVLGFIQTVESERIHVFLSTGVFSAPIIIYAKRFFKNLTFDSAAFSLTGARFRKFWLPYQIQRGISFGESYTATLKNIPCSCPVCRLSTIDDFNSKVSIPGGLIALHNLWLFLEYINTLQALADSPDDYVEFVSRLGKPETTKMVKFLRCVEENDFEFALKKFNMSEMQDARSAFG